MLETKSKRRGNTIRNIKIKFEIHDKASFKIPKSSFFFGRIFVFLLESFYIAIGSFIRSSKECIFT